MKKILIKSVTKVFFIFLFVYQNVISPFMSPSCRYYPSCSNFAKSVLNQFGLAGTSLILKRILQCNLFFKGGYDPVPVKIIKKTKHEQQY